MEAIVKVFEVHMFQCYDGSFLEIGGFDADVRYTNIFSFLHHSDIKIGVFQMNRLCKMVSRNKIELLAAQ